VRYAFLFWLMNALVSGDIYGDRMLWGLALLLAFRSRDPTTWMGRLDRSKGPNFTPARPGTRVEVSSGVVEGSA
jgi:hypothetical protein